MLMKDQHLKTINFFAFQLPHKSTTTFWYCQTFFKLFLSPKRHLSFINVWRFFRRSLVRLVGCFTIPSNYPTKIRAILQKSSGKVSNVGKTTKKVQFSCVSPLWLLYIASITKGEPSTTPTPTNTPIRENTPHLWHVRFVGFGACPRVSRFYLLFWGFCVVLCRFPLNWVLFSHLVTVRRIEQDRKQRRNARHWNGAL